MDLGEEAKSSGPQQVKSYSGQSGDCGLCLKCLYAPYKGDSSDVKTNRYVTQHSLLNVLNVCRLGRD